jgi:hypothetical protein
MAKNKKTVFSLQNKNIAAAIEPKISCRSSVCYGKALTRRKEKYATQKRIGAQNQGPGQKGRAQSQARNVLRRTYSENNLRGENEGFRDKISKQILMFSRRLSGEIFLGFWPECRICSPNDFSNRF